MTHMKLRSSTFVVFIALFYASDLISALFSMLWNVPQPLALNWIFCASLSVTHAVLAALLSWRNEIKLAGLMAISSSVLGYLLFSLVTFDVNFLLRSGVPVMFLCVSSAISSIVSSTLSSRMPKRQVQPLQEVPSSMLLE